MSDYRVPETAPTPAKTNSLAIVSMILGILSVLMFIPSFCIPCLNLMAIIVGVVAAVLGFMSKKQIDQSGGVESGRPMAVAGLIMGLITSGILLLLFIINLIFGLSLMSLGTLPFLQDFSGGF